MRPALAFALMVVLAVVFGGACAPRERRVTYFEDGQKWSAIELENGVPVGTWTTWFENGQLQSTGDYANGVRHGKWTTWFSNERMHSNGSYSRGTPDGVWEYWFENGNRASRGTYEDGRLEGLWEWWYGSGHPRSSAGFENGLQHGISRRFWEDGVPREAHRYVNGERTRSHEWFPDGQLRVRGAFENRLREGPWHVWRHDGSYHVELSGEYRADVRIGPVDEPASDEEFEL